MTKKYEIDMCEGPLLPKLIVFAVPLMLSSVLQLLYNAADVIVVGKFAGSTALAAVSSTGSLINLIVNLFIGLSIGTNVAAARFYGARDKEGVRQTVHTAMLLGVLGGIGVGLIGFFGAKTFLTWMDSPEDVIDQAALYVRLFFLGIPAAMVYNFGAAILRAIGDTRRPLVYLMISGLVNVILNLIMVIVFSMGVAGVALATVVSQILSAYLVVRCLMKAEGTSYQLRLKELYLYKDKLLIIVRTGVPAGIQGAVFSISNVLIQSSINSFGSIVMAGNGAAGNIEGFIYVSMNAFYQAAVTFTSQNLGAHDFKRIRRILVLCLCLVTVVGLLVSYSILFNAEFLLGIYDSNPDVIAFGVLRMKIISSTYFICGIMDVMCGMLRGLGSSVTPMIISMLGACGFRVFWIYTFFRWDRTLECLYISYPISWVITALAYAVGYVIMYRRVKRQYETGLQGQEILPDTAK